MTSLSTRPNASWLSDQLPAFLHSENCVYCVPGIQPGTVNYLLTTTPLADVRTGVQKGRWLSQGSLWLVNLALPCWPPEIRSLVHLTQLPSFARLTVEPQPNKAGSS